MSGRAIHVKIDGRTYSGTFTVDRGIITVKTSYASKRAEYGRCRSTRLPFVRRYRLAARSWFASTGISTGDSHLQ
jgi:hypothetical protein